MEQVRQKGKQTRLGSIFKKKKNYQSSQEVKQSYSSGSTKKLNIRTFLF